MDEHRTRGVVRLHLGHRTAWLCQAFGLCDSGGWCGRAVRDGLSEWTAEAQPLCFQGAETSGGRGRSRRGSRQRHGDAFETAPAVLGWGPRAGWQGGRRRPQDRRIRLARIRGPGAPIRSVRPRTIEADENKEYEQPEVPVASHRTTLPPPRPLWQDASLPTQSREGVRTKRNVSACLF